VLRNLGRLAGDDSNQRVCHKVIDLKNWTALSAT
jgi:hypothetical protein